MSNIRKNNKITICFFIICTLLCAHTTRIYAKIPADQKIRLTGNWQYLRGDIGNIWEAVRPASAGSPETVPLWKNVSLPHCFNAEDAVDPDVNYYQGPGWYKTLLDINNPYPNGRILLEFEGAGQKTEVYVYTEKAGSHVGGYDEWSVDITDAVAGYLADSEAVKRFNGKVPISIRCDNSSDAEMIPSDLSDFNLYGGIYRYLNLVYLPALSIENIFIDASVDNKGQQGKVGMNISIYDPANIKSGKATVVISDPEGKEIIHKTCDVTGGISNLLFSEIIKKPKRWSPETPQLYTCSVQLESSAGKISATEKFGFRHFEFVEKGPFLLNGKRLLLRGTHRHEDHAGVAAAMTEEMICSEMKMMKDMGVNFIRLGHYQQSHIVLEQCDSLGILVWEEIPWCRGGLGGAEYKEQAKRMLKNMITQHRNHPSVILWGLGNENDWPNDFEYFDKEDIRAFMKELHDLSHEIDDTRMTCIRRCDFCKDIVDVYSPSIWAGWYRGMITDYKRVSYDEMQRVKHFLHVEWGGDSHARRHAEDPYRYLDAIETGKGADERAGDASLYGGNARASKDGEWSESYICNLIDWHLKEQETMSWLTGAAYWPFKDFSTPVRPENPVPYMNQKGVVERDLTPKESYYVFQSWWTKKPMAHIYGHTWLVRWGDEGEQKEIKVYSNCDEVELFLNGESKGKKKRDKTVFPAAGLFWELPFRKGENTVRAVARKGKETITDEISFVYQTEKWGTSAQTEVTITPVRDGEYWVEATLLDNKGVLCLDSRDYIEFQVAGDAKMIANQGTSSGSRKVQAYNGRARIKVVLNNGKNGVVSVLSEGKETKILPIK
ncbi:MAG: glycoside hydrolase family 2 protein [Tannerella sp.]|jgi:beta-galactosidase|nr:glycoside hydrolase family 2 protein [Tannerella sp.]